MKRTLSALLLSTALVGGIVAAAPALLLPAATAQDMAAGTPAEVDVDALIALIPADADVKVTYGSKSYDAATGATTLTDVVISPKEGADRANVRIAELSARGVDRAAFETIFKFDAYGATPSETFLQLLGEVSARDVTVSGDGQEIAKIATARFGGLRMKQLPLKPPAPGAPDEENVKFLGAVLDSVETGEIAVEGVTLPGANFDGDGEVKGSIGRIAYGPFARGRMGPSSIEAVDVTTPDGQTKVESATSDGFDMSAVLPFMIKGEMPPVGPAPLLSIGAAQATGLSIATPDADVAIARYGFAPVSFYWLVPSSLDISIMDMTVTPKGDGAQEFADLGLEKLDLDFALNWTFDGAAGTARIADLKVAETQLAEVALTVDLTGIDLAKLVDPAQSTGALYAIGLKFGQIFLKNNGGVEKLIEQQAKEEGMTPEAIKQQALDAIAALEQGQAGGDGIAKPPSERVKAIAAALRAFVESPGTLTIKVEPSSPITPMQGIGAMVDPIAAADTFGVTVQSTPK